MCDASKTLKPEQEMTQQKKREVTLSNILTPADVLAVLKQAMIALGMLTILSGVIFVWTREEAWLVFLRNSLIGFFIGLGLIPLITRGKTVLAAYLTLTIFGGLFIVIAFDGAGVRGLAYSMLVLVVIGSGLFLGRQTGFSPPLSSPLLVLYLCWLQMPIYL